MNMILKIRKNIFLEQKLYESFHNNALYGLIMQDISVDLDCS